MLGEPDLEVLALVPATERLAELAAAAGDPEADRALALARVGRQFADAILVVAHGNTSLAACLALPRPRAVLQWVAAAGPVVDAVAALDPEWTKALADRPDPLRVPPAPALRLDELIARVASPRAEIGAVSPPRPAPVAPAVPVAPVAPLAPAGPAVPGREPAAALVQLARAAAATDWAGDAFVDRPRRGRWDPSRGAVLTDARSVYADDAIDLVIRDVTGVDAAPEPGDAAHRSAQYRAEAVSAAYVLGRALLGNDREHLEYSGTPTADAAANAHALRLRLHGPCSPDLLSAALGPGTVGAIVAYSGRLAGPAWRSGSPAVPVEARAVLVGLALAAAEADLTAAPGHRP